MASEVSSAPATYVCERCGAEHAYVPVTYGRAALPAPRLCPGCYSAWAAETEAADAAAARAERVALWSQICPPLYQRTDTAHPRFPREHFQRVMAWRFGPRGLLLLGDTREGKTRCLYKVLERLFVDERRDVQVWGPGALEDELLSAFTTNRYHALRARAVTVPVLALDDLGKDKLTDRYESFIFGIIDERIAWERPTLITSNLTGAALAERFSDAVKARPFVERLREFCDVVNFSA